MRSKLNIIFFLLISSIFGFQGFSQEMQGEWNIDRLMLDLNKNEYILSPVDTTIKRWRYTGNHFSFNEDGSFRCWYTAPCGMDCFPTTEGKFTVVDEHHIQFILDTVYQHGPMCGALPEQTFPLNIGLFYINRDGDEISLIKSDGNLEQDKLNAYYIQFIDEYSLQNSKLTDLSEEIIPPVERTLGTPENIFELYSSSIGKEDCKILYSKELDRRGLVVLIEEDRKLKCIYSTVYELDGEFFIQGIQVYNTELLDEIDFQVAQIESKLKTFKREIPVADKNGVNSTAKIFSRKGQIEKVILERKFSRGKERITYYLRDNTLFFARVEIDGVNEKVRSSREFYLKSDGTFGSKEALRLATGGIHPSRIYDCIPYLNAIFENKN